MSTLRARTFEALLAGAFLVFVYLFVVVFLQLPVAEPRAGGSAQKILYLSVPAGYATLLCGGVCFLGSSWELVRAGSWVNALVTAAAECAALLALLLFTGNSLLCEAAFGCFWLAQPGLTTTLAFVLVHLLISVLRARRTRRGRIPVIGSVLGVLGLPALYAAHHFARLSVLPRGRVVEPLALPSPLALSVLLVGCFAITFFTIVLLWLRAEIAHSGIRLERMERIARRI